MKFLANTTANTISFLLSPFGIVCVSKYQDAERRKRMEKLTKDFKDARKPSVKQLADAQRTYMSEMGIESTLFD